MLQRLVDRHGSVLDPILANRRDAFVNQAASTHRYVEHREAEERPAASLGSELYWLTRKLRFLFQACMLAELGFGPDRISHFFSRSAYFQHISRLEASSVGNSTSPREVDISFQFIVPAEAVMESATKMAASGTSDEKVVGSALLELTDITIRTQAAVQDVASKENYDLAVYLDYKFGDSLEAANRLKDTPDKDIRYVAETLIRQSEAVESTKSAVLRVTKPAT
jgi:hypothetical protein